jgi:hypothetical protein
MFGDDTQQAVHNDGSMPPMDPGVMADPASLAPPAADHQMTPAYPTDDNPAPISTDPTMSNSPAPVVSTHPEDQELLGIKQDALNALSPLVGSLDQSPEEKFRTTMMLIQASDDRSLVRVAYEAAQAIVDDKSKAQALLDVINEINYFTSHTS